VRRSGINLVHEGFFTDTKALARCAAELDALDHGDKPLAQRHQIDGAVLDRHVRVREVANWIERCVLPLRTQNGRE
jgi:hypothetical protein